MIGRSGSGKTSKVRELVVENVRRGNDKVLVLVPEQNSFDTERSMLETLGERDFEKVEVLSFTRLCDFVFRRVGMKKHKTLSDGGRNMFMSMAIESVKSGLRLYKKSSNDIEMVELMVSTLKEFKMFQLSGEVLTSMLEKLGDGTLKEKLRETKLILDKYSELLSNKFSDPLDDLDILEDTLNISGEDIFSGYTVFIDSFNGFTLQQLSVLKHIFVQSSDVYITFCCDDVLDDTNNDIGLFSSINKNIKSVYKVIKDSNIEDVKIVKLGDSKRFENEELNLLEKGLFCGKKEVRLGDTSNIRMFNASNVYDECDFVAREIKRNIVEHGYRYKDFAVIGRNICNYTEIIENVFKKYDLRYFFDEPELICSKSLMSLVLSAFEVIHSNYGFNEVFRYLKTGLVGFDTEEISVVENYVLLWEIRGDTWKTDFKFNPEGFSSDNSDKSNELLIKINELRSKIIVPLINFERRIRNSTGEKIAKAVYLLLEEINAGENIRMFCNVLKGEGRISEAEEQARLWDILMEALNQTAIVIGQDKITSKRYMELLKVVIESGDISFIPRGLDEIVIGSVDRIRVSTPKVVFVIGAVEGEFPRTPVQAGIFSDVERKKLISMGLNLYDTLDEISIHERFLVYFALTRASEKLYVSWASSSINGSGKLPSEIIREIKKIFPNSRVIDRYSQDVLDDFWSEKVSFERCAANWNSDSETIDTLKYYFRNNEQYRHQIECIDKVVKNEPLDFENPENAKRLFGDRIRISASQIEKYYLCRFYYFCKYGLKAKERKPAKFNAMEYGSLIHYILEDIFSNNKLDKLFLLSDVELNELVKISMDNYVCKKLGGLEDKPARFKYLYLRCADVANILVRRIIEEFRQSKFTPLSYEAEISDKGPIKPLRIRLLDGSIVEVEGKVDRVDVMEEDGKSYIRIVDYKTGTKMFKISDILYGLNMQMMIYMTAICNNGYDTCENMLPAGILYMPSNKPLVSAEHDDDDKKINLKTYKKLCMNGIVLDSPEVVTGMEKDASGIFIPAVMKDGEVKVTDSVVSLEQMGIMMRYVEKLIRQMAECLREGKVSSKPLLGEYNSCEWCPYGSICGQEDDKNKCTINKLSKEKALKRMQEEENDNG